MADLTESLSNLINVTYAVAGLKVLEAYTDRSMARKDDDSAFDWCNRAFGP